MRYSFLNISFGLLINCDWWNCKDIGEFNHFALLYVKQIQNILLCLLSKILQKRVFRCYNIWSVLLYGTEPWTPKVALMKKLEACEMWLYRAIFKIFWTVHITNEELLRRIGSERELWHRPKTGKVSYLGHLLWNEKYEMAQLKMERKLEGKRGIDRHQMSWWLQNIRKQNFFWLAEYRNKFTMVKKNYLLYLFQLFSVLFINHYVNVNICNGAIFCNRLFSFQILNKLLYESTKSVIYFNVSAEATLSFHFNQGSIVNLHSSKR